MFGVSCLILKFSPSFWRCVYYINYQYCFEKIKFINRKKRKIK